MTAVSLLSIDDGTLNLVVSSCAMFSGSTGRADTGTGHGIVEYADGSAKRWMRFEARILSISGDGPAPHGLWALDLTVPTWAVTVTSFDNDGSTDSWTVVPARPSDNRNVNTGRTSWTLSLRAAAAE